jgi:hypothetical protein
MKTNLNLEINQTNRRREKSLKKVAPVLMILTILTVFICSAEALTTSIEELISEEKVDVEIIVPAFSSSKKIVFRFYLK